MFIGCEALDHLGYELTIRTQITEEKTCDPESLIAHWL